MQVFASYFFCCRIYFIFCSFYSESIFSTTLSLNWFEFPNFPFISVDSFSPVFLFKRFFSYQNEQYLNPNFQRLIRLRVIWMGIHDKKNPMIQSCVINDMQSNQWFGMLWILKCKITAFLYPIQNIRIHFFSLLS